MKSSERLCITLILCLTLLAAVWLHGILNRYAVIPESGDATLVTRYDRITGRVWVMTTGGKTIELGVKSEANKVNP